MKCYYHTDVDAVSHCRVCKKFLCKSCYDYSKDGTCSSCLREDELANAEYKRAALERSKRESQKEYKVYKRNLMIAAFIGIVFSMFFLFNFEFRDAYDILFGVVISIIAVYFAISVYSGYLLIKWDMPYMIDVWVFAQIKFLVSMIFHIIKLPIATGVGIFGAIPLFLKKRQKYLEIIDE